MVVRAVHPQRRGPGPAGGGGESVAPGAVGGPNPGAAVGVVGGREGGPRRRGCGQPEVPVLPRADLSRGRGDEARESGDVQDGGRGRGGGLPEGEGLPVVSGTGGGDGRPPARPPRSPTIGRGGGRTPLRPGGPPSTVDRGRSKPRRGFRTTSPARHS